MRKGLVEVHAAWIVLSCADWLFIVCVCVCVCISGFEYQIFVEDTINPAENFGFSAPFVVGDIEVPSPLPPPPFPPPLFDIDFGTIPVETLQPADQQLQIGSTATVELDWTDPPNVSVPFVRIEFVTLNEQGMFCHRSDCATVCWHLLLILLLLLLLFWASTPMIV